MNERSACGRFRRRYVFAIGFAVGLFALTGSYAFYHAGSWLVREDSLEKSQAILVLSGGLPYCALGAAEIYLDGYAKEVWLTEPLQPGAAMEGLHLPYAGEQEYSRMVLIEKGVRPGDIRILKPRILNTADELHFVAEALEQRPGNPVIVVTSKAHTRRVRALWEKVARGRGSGRILVRAAPEDDFDASHWWRSTSDALSVVREYLGLLNVWAGLPLTHTK